METAQHHVATAGTVVLDRYALLEEIGTGGFGAVWLARDQRLERQVAVKRIPVRSGAAAERAEREGLAAARLSHPAVVSLYEAGRDEDAVYLVSELVRGHTLGELLAEGALSDRDVVVIGLAMCDALAHAHSRGVIHRDVKPGNVLVPESSTDGVHAKLTDFGIARIAGDDALTATGDVVGTLAYMAPEQAEGKGATAASDVYALALVLYEALSGVNPIRQANAAATARRVGMRLPALRRLRSDLPRSLCATIDACVLPDPAMRGSLESLRLVLAEALRTVTDDPGTVETPAWARNGSYTVTRRAHGEETEDLEGPDERGWFELPRVPPAARIAAGLLGGAASYFTLSLAANTLPITPEAAAGLSAAAIALLPRVGWLLTAALLVAYLGDEDTDAWWIVGLAAAPMPALIPLRTAWWSTPGIAVALGWISAAAAWPVIAGQAKTLWTRAVLGAAGFWTLSLAALLLDRHLLIEPATSLRALIESPTMAIGAVWAAAAALLPLFVRGRNVGADFLGAVVWGAACAVATTYAAVGSEPRGVAGATAVAVIAATLAGALRRT